MGGGLAERRGIRGGRLEKTKRMKQIKRMGERGFARGKWRQSIEKDAKVFGGIGRGVGVGAVLYNSKMAALNCRVV